MDDTKLNDILGYYDFGGDVVRVEPNDQGRINTTYRLYVTGGKQYILQKINHNVFRDVDGLMRNISLVTKHIKAKAPSERGIDIIATTDDMNYVRVNDEYFRVYNSIENATSFDTTDSLKVVEECGRAFGAFQRKLADFDASQLITTLPDFHNTVKRLSDLQIAFENCSDFHRRCKAFPLYRFLMERTEYAYVNMQRNLPKRVTHNDPKLNNAMFDIGTGKCVAVIDLDTVMPGLVADDFGDAVRCICSTASEDEIDLTRIKFAKNKFKAFARGFLSETADSLSHEEVASLTDGCFALTYELSMRFLTDYLNGDTYFKVSEPGVSNENLMRAKNQATLLSKMEENREYMCKTVQEIVNAADRKID